MWDDRQILSPEMENSAVFSEDILCVCGHAEKPAKTPSASSQLFR